LQENEVWRKAGSVLFFAPFADEPHLDSLLAVALNARKLVALPRFDSGKKNYVACQIQNLTEDLVSGQFGIREPNNSCPVLSLNRLDLILVPGIAFDLHGRRLGRGKGYYDQLLADVRGTTCGMAFDEQIVADIPMEPHDIPLNCILTPTRWIEP
jgi:5-formyltetrahydrofolate cyclo-ligase